MPFLLPRLAAAVSASLRRSLCTARSRPPWAMVSTEVVLDASAGAPSPGARASFDLNAAPGASQLSVPARFVDPRGDAVDFLDGLIARRSGRGRRRPTTGRLFVCNPLSGQLFRLPAPDLHMMHVLKLSSATPLGLLTQSSEGSHGPPDRYVVAQLSSGRGAVVRRFLSETGQWDERPLVVPEPFALHGERQLLTDHEVLAFGDRLWWVDVSWGVCSVDPFSDRPEPRFVELPDCSVLHPTYVGGLAGSLILSRYRRMGFSEGKLRFIHLASTPEKTSLIGSFSLDVESCSWTLDHQIEMPEWAPRRCAPNALRIAAMDPFKASVLYLQDDGEVYAVDMAKARVISKSPLPDKVVCQMARHSSFVLPCVLPTYLASSYIPGIFPPLVPFLTSHNFKPCIPLEPLPEE
ncbi:unnamed protein product [Alopecurus aequalis]